MRRAIFYITLIGVAIIASCTKDPETDGATGGTETKYGSDRSFYVEANLSTDMPGDREVPEGEVGIYMTLANGINSVLTAQHEVVDGNSHFTFDQDLPIGDNITHAILFGDDCTMTTEDLNSAENNVAFGLKLVVEEAETALSTTTYSKVYSSAGEGTSNNPYKITSAKSLVELAIIMDEDIDFIIPQSTYFEQKADLDFSEFTTNSGHLFDGLCKDLSRPFRAYYDGRNYNIYYLEIARFNDATQQPTQSSGIDATGLFCYVAQANIKRVNICKPTIIGYYCVGALIGAVIQVSGIENACTNVTNCNLISDSSISTVTTIFGYSNIGGLVGSVDDNAALNMVSCTNRIDSSYTVAGKKDSINSYDTSAPGSGFCGGLVGGAYLNTNVILTDCSNSMDLTVDGTTAVGGLIGGGYQMTISACKNSADITASSAMGVGGIVGGSLNATLVASENSGKVTGYEGVGGIIGSTANDTDEKIYGSINCTSLYNSGEVTATQNAGGLAGCAQVRFINSYNDGTITSTSSCAGGLVGYAPVATIYNSNNLGEVTAADAAGGFAGMNYWVNYVAANNLGDITGTKNAGGLVGRAGSYGSINFCNNYGSVLGCEDSGGIAGSMGDSAEWEFDYVALFDILVSALCVVGDFGADLLKEHEQPKLSKWIARISVGTEIGKSVIMTIYEPFEFPELFDEGEELVEPLEYHDIDIEDIIATLEEIDEDTSTNMDTAIKASANLNYSGNMSINFNPAKLCYENSLAFATYIATTTPATDDDEYVPDDDTNPFYKYSVAVNERLDKRATKEVRKEKAKEISIYLEKAIVSAVTIVAGVITGGIGYGITNLVNEIVMEAITETTENDLNVIFVDQVANFGTTSGSGIVGETGDEMMIYNALSASTVDHGAIGGDWSNGSQYLVVGEEELPLWDGDGMDNTSRTSEAAPIIWTDKNSSTNRYTATQIATSDPYTSNNFDKQNHDLGEKKNLWILDDYSFAIPYDNIYLSFQETAVEWD